MAKELSSSVRGVKQAYLQTITQAQSAATATGNGTAVQPKTFPFMCVVRGITTATVKIEVSTDGTNYVQYGSDITADKAVEVLAPAPYVRLRISAYTSGTINAYIVE